MRIGVITVTILIATPVQLLFALPVRSQPIGQVEVKIGLKNETLVDAFQKIEAQSPFHFMYRNEEVKNIKNLNLPVSQKNVEQVLKIILSKTSLTFRQVNNQILIMPAKNWSTESALKDATTISLTDHILTYTPVANNVHGKVTNTSGEPLAGVSVTVKGTATGSSTDGAGNYLIDVPKNGTLVFSFVGYATKEVPLNGRSEINMVMELSVSSLEQVVVVGYGTQKKATLTGAISSVTSRDILTTTNENVENMLTGKLPGVRISQQSSEPGSFSNTFDIRGFGTPLIIIDGVPRSNMEQLDPNDIESISVLKDASAAVYGVRAANGVVLITTKHGKAGTLQLTYTGTVGVQHPSGLPTLLNAVDWMTLMNEQQMHNPNGGSLAFSQADIDQYKNGTKKSADWFPAVINPYAMQTEHNLSASGGTDKASYYISLGYLRQDGFWKSGDLNYKRYNVRSNITSKITKRLTAQLMVSAIMDQKNQPYADSWSIFKSLWRQLPTQSVYANNNPEYLGNTLDGTNPAAMISSDVSGYKIFNNKWVQSSFSLTYDMPFINGLQAKGLYSYDYNMSDDKQYQKAFNLYNYDAATNTYTPVVSQSPSNLYRSFSENPSSLLQVSLNYNHLFNKVHNVSGLLLYEESTQSGDNFYASRDLTLQVDQLIAGSALNQVGYMNVNGLYKQVNEGLVGRFNYDYKSKYLAEFSFRYDGSSKFPPARQWGFFPAASAGWVISKENFMRNSSALSFIDNLKLRASYGKMGDDAASSYQFISGYTYPASGGNSQALAGGYVLDGNFVNSIGFTNLPNPDITWYTANMFDAGVDLDMWHGLLGVTVDVFNRNRHGLLATELLSLPSTLGAGLPQENLNSDQTSGFEVAISHKNTIGKFGYSVSGNFSYTRTRWINYIQSTAGNSYQNWLDNLNNRYNDIWWGYGSAGQYQSFTNIINSPTFVSRSTLPGDYIEQDWNGDGVIDANDLHPVAIGYNGKVSQGSATPNPPLIYFGLTLGATYKGFDLNALFQGAAMVWISYPELLAQPFYFNGGSGLSQFTNDWHPADPAADPYDPNTRWIPGYYAYTGSVADPNSEQSVRNASYLRLKSLEIGYTLPKRLTLKAGINSVRFYLNGYDLLTFTGIKYVDPEHPSDLYGYVYPLNKSYNIGLSVDF